MWLFHFTGLGSHPLWTILTLVICVRVVDPSVLWILLPVGSPIKCIVFCLKGHPSLDQQFSDPFQWWISLIFLYKPFKGLSFPSLKSPNPFFPRYLVTWNTMGTLLWSFNWLKTLSNAFTENCCSGGVFMRGLLSRPFSLFGSERFRTLWCSLDHSNNDSFLSCHTSLSSVKSVGISY